MVVNPDKCNASESTVALLQEDVFGLDLDSHQETEHVSLLNFEGKASQLDIIVLAKILIKFFFSIKNYIAPFIVRWLTCLQFHLSGCIRSIFLFSGFHLIGLPVSRIQDLPRNTVTIFPNHLKDCKKITYPDWK